MLKDCHGQTPPAKEMELEIFGRGEPRSICRTHKSNLKKKQAQKGQRDTTKETELRKKKKILRVQQKDLPPQYDKEAETEEKS